MRVGLIGNIANNAFNMVNILRAQGVDARLIDDGADLFAFSRPFWEEVPYRLSFQDLGRNWSFGEWLSLERELRWHAQDRLIRPGIRVNRSMWSRLRALLRETVRQASRDDTRQPFEVPEALMAPFKPDEAVLLRSYAAAFPDTILALKTFDVVVAFGSRAAALCYLAERPTIYFTYGGDARVELGQARDDLRCLSSTFAKILASDRFVIEGYGCDEEINDILASKGLLSKVAYAYLPNVNTALLRREWDQGTERRRIGWPEGKVIFFMASRLSSEWKASERFIEAFARQARRRDDLLLVISGWGSDYERTVKWMRAEGLEDRIVILPESYTKLELFARYASADVVVDQFKVGSLGSVSYEAMCMGRPVLTYVAPFNLCCYPEPPPVRNACEPADLEAAICELADSPPMRERLSRDAADWYRRVYSDDNLVRCTIGLAQQGPKAWQAFAGTKNKTLRGEVIPVPGLRAWVRVLDWPNPFRAGLAIVNDCEFYNWDDFCAVHQWLNGPVGTDTPMGPALGLPVSDSFWFYSQWPDGEGFSYFDGTDPTHRSRFAGAMAELIRAGTLDVLHTFGGFDHEANFMRRLGSAALEELDRIGGQIEVWTNHGSSNNRQNLRGSFGGDHACGDDQESDAYHADLLVAAGFQYFWLDSYATNRFSLGNAAGRDYADGLVVPDTGPWGDRILCPDVLLDGQEISVFRRFRGARALAPDAQNVGEQLTAHNLDHLEESGGGALIYQHLGCFRATDGTPGSRAGRSYCPTTLDALRDLSGRFHTQQIWVAPTIVFLRYLRTISDLCLRFERSGEGLDLILFGRSHPLTERDLAGVTIRIEGPFRPHRVFVGKHASAQAVCALYRVELQADRMDLVWPIDAGLCDFPSTL